jgi:hypothetical protein
MIMFELAEENAEENEHAIKGLVGFDGCEQ